MAQREPFVTVHAGHRTLRSLW